MSVLTQYAGFPIATSMLLGFLMRGKERFQVSAQMICPICPLRIILQKTNITAMVNGWPPRQNQYTVPAAKGYLNYDILYKHDFHYRPHSTHGTQNCSVILS